MTRTAIAIGLAMAAHPATADVVDSRSALGGDDFIEWGQLGPDRATIVGPASGLTSGGIGFEVTDSDSELQRRDFGISYGGSILLDIGEPLLWNAGASQTISISFDEPVFGIGANFLPSTVGEYTAELSLFDGSGDLVDSAVRAGIETGFSDPDASFLGVTSSLGFTRADFSLSGLSGFLLLNTVDIVTVPAPSTAALLGVAGLAAACRRR